MKSNESLRCRFFRYTLGSILGILFLLSSGCEVSRALRQPIPTSVGEGINDERTEKIGDVVKKTMRKYKIPGVSVAVVDHGRVIWAQGFGWRDVSEKLPVDLDTQFQAGSISKPFTALAMLRLKDSGKLDLDKDVNTYLTSWHLDSQYTNNPITSRELLCHRAGMVPHGFLGYTEYSKPHSLDEVLNDRDEFCGWVTGRYFGRVKVAYSPGSRFRYSGGGYCVVQKTVEDVTGESFESVMQELVLRPLRMARSTFAQPPADVANTARGYGPLPGIIARGRWRVYPEQAPAGLWSTPRDIARMIIAVQEARAGHDSGPISHAMADEFLSARYDGWQGLGVRLGGTEKHPSFYHAGETIGYMARFAGGMNDSLGWVIMTNAQKDHLGEIQRAIAREFNWPP